MTRYLVGRGVETALTLAVMSFIVYLLIGLMPGDPIQMMIAGDPRMTSEDAARLRELELPLDEMAAVLELLVERQAGRLGVAAVDAAAATSTSAARAGAIRGPRPRHPPPRAATPSSSFATGASSRFSSPR